MVDLSSKHKHYLILWIHNLLNHLGDKFNFGDVLLLPAGSLIFTYLVWLSYNLILTKALNWFLIIFFFILWNLRFSLFLETIYNQIFIFLSFENFINIIINFHTTKITRMDGRSHYPLSQLTSWLTRKMFLTRQKLSSVSRSSIFFVFLCQCYRC